MSVYKANSWGRTRRPKAPNNQDKNLITGSAGLAALNTLSTASFTAANGCYQTENQRYMHLMCSGSSTVSNVYAYNYASGYWHELMTVNNADGSRDSIAVGNDEHIIVDINGADWVSVKSGSLSVVTMAFSTF
tara:strand:- start:1374 stop:1772 length:399 start_codon:yes stop_codon:yes gene_type:complete